MESTTENRQSHPNNKLDITIHNNTKQSCLLIETALLGYKKCEPERS